MIKRKSREPLTEIEVGSFSDIAFLLIIFFILTTQIAAFTGFSLDIPSGAPSKQESTEDKQVTVNIGNGGSDIQVSIGKDTGVNVTYEELKLKLLQENFPAKEPEKRFVIVDSQADVPYDIFYKVVMIIRSTGGVLSLVDYSAAGDGGGGGAQ